MTSFISNVGGNIRHARRSRGHTQESLARALDVSVRAVGAWERASALPNRKNLLQLAAELDRKPEWFYAVHEPAEAAA